MAKPDWYQRVLIDHFYWTIAGPSNWLVWAKEFLWHCPGIAKNISSKLSRKFPRHCQGNLLDIVEELIKTRCPDSDNDGVSRLDRQNEFLVSGVSRCCEFSCKTTGRSLLHTGAHRLCRYADLTGWSLTWQRQRFWIALSIIIFSSKLLTLLRQVLLHVVRLEAVDSQLLVLMPADIRLAFR